MASGLRADAPSFSVGGGGGAAAWLAPTKPAQRLPGALVTFLPQDNDESASDSAAEVRIGRLLLCTAAPPATDLDRGTLGSGGAERSARAPACAPTAAVLGPRCVSVLVGAELALTPVTACSRARAAASARPRQLLALSATTARRWLAGQRDRRRAGAASVLAVASTVRLRRVSHPLRAAQALTRPTRARHSATPGEQGGPPPDTQAALLRQHAPLTAPRLLDACALFGPDNGELTGRLVQNALTLVPRLLEEFAAAGAAAGASVAEVLERCDAALTPGAEGTTRADELADGVAYFVDVGATLAAFARAAPQAAAMLAGEGASLLPTLAALHDRLCPKLARAVPLLASAAGRAQAAARDACAALLLAAYLSPRGGGETARASRCEGLLLVVHACSAVEENPGGCGLLRDLAAASSFRVALDEADLALDSEQLAFVHAAFGRASTTVAEPSAAARVDPLTLSRIAAVRDVLPHLGDGFVMACLAALGNEPERVVAAVLEGALPGSLSTMDQTISLEQFTAQHHSRQPSQPKAPPTPTPPPRPAAPAPKLQVLPKKGERNRWERDEGVQLLNERDANAASVALARAAIFEEEEAVAEKEAAGFVADEYDDEYDDTYDDLAVHVSEAATDADGDGDAEAAATQLIARPASLRPPPASTGPAPRSRAIPAAGGRQSKFWLLDGKVYSYAKAGAEVVTAASTEEAAQLAAARAAEAASLIHGLGAGGNRGPPVASGGNAGASSSEEEDGEAAAVGGASGGAGRGRHGPPDGSRARARKEQNKGAVGNHHRKDRAANKQRALLGPM